MKLWVRRLSCSLLSLVGVLTVAFFALGGMQIVHVLRGPSLPAAPAQASPSSDVLFLRETVLANERATPEELERFSRVLDRAPAVTSVDDFTVLATRALAELGNAHSTLSLPVMHRLPIRLHWLDDGLIVVKARQEYAQLLGRKILAIDGVAPDELAERARQLVGGGTPGWARYRSEYFLTAPTALRFLGAADGGGDTVLQTVDSTGVSEEVHLPVDAEAVPCPVFLAWMESLPGDEHCGTAGWRTLLAPGPSLPLVQQEPKKLYLVRDVPEHDALYLRMNGSVNSVDETAAAFVARASIAMRTSGRRNVIVDLRYNWGGGFDLSLPLARAVARDAPAVGRIYLIVGPNTFSAGLITASQLKAYAPTRLTIVGEGVGDQLRFRAEGALVTLPATRTEAYVTSAWDDVGETCGWFADCWPPNKFALRGVGTFAPGLRVGNTWASYAAGRDLVVEAIYSDIAGRTSNLTSRPS